MSANKIIFDTIRPWLDAQGFTAERVRDLDSACARFAQAIAGAQNPVATDGLTVPIFLEMAHHEAFVQEAYKDSEGIWTWAMGVTNASGHKIDRYKDNPQSLENCIDVSIWLLRTHYLPEVLGAFKGRTLTESQLAAALSFHWNTGAIAKTNWVTMFLAGDHSGARRFLETHYLNDGDLTARRKAEAALFFDGVWSNDGKTTLYEVSKPSYSPKWSSARRVDISGMVRAALGG